MSLCLEPIEERWLLNAAASPTPSPPSQFQAVLSLYLDGAYLQTQSLVNQYIPNIMGYYDVPSTMANETSSAAAAGINLNAVLSLNNYLGNTQTDLNAAQNSLYNYRSEWLTADLQFNWQYAGPFAASAVMAGAQGAVQAAKQ